MGVISRVSISERDPAERNAVESRISMTPRRTNALAEARSFWMRRPARLGCSHGGSRKRCTRNRSKPAPRDRQVIIPTRDSRRDELDKTRERQLADRYRFHDEPRRRCYDLERGDPARSAHPSVLLLLLLLLRYPRARICDGGAYTVPSVSVKPSKFESPVREPEASERASELSILYAARLIGRRSPRRFPRDPAEKFIYRASLFCRRRKIAWKPHVL